MKCVFRATNYTCHVSIMPCQEPLKSRPVSAMSSFLRSSFLVRSQQIHWRASVLWHFLGKTGSTWIGFLGVILRRKIGGKLGPTLGFRKPGFLVPIRCLDASLWSNEQMLLAKNSDGTWPQKLTSKHVYLQTAKGPQCSYPEKSRPHSDTTKYY